MFLLLKQFLLTHTLFNIAFSTTVGQASFETMVRLAFDQLRTKHRFFSLNDISVYIVQRM